MKANRLFDANNLADELGQLRAEIKQLQDCAKGIESLLKAKGVGATENDLYRAVVSTVETESVNWKAVAQKLSPSRQLVRAHTKFRSALKLTLTAHTKGA